MKSIKEFKKELHEYIDGISDQKKLMVIYENTLKNSKGDSRKDEVNENDHLANFERMSDLSSDRNKRDLESKKSMERWFNEGGKNAC